jgi:hypothetical protein
MTKGLIALIIFVILVVWVALYVMADKTTNISPLPVVPLPVSQSTSTPPVPVVPPVLISTTTTIPVAKSGTLTLGIGEVGTLGDLKIIPRAVVEDSRCPIGVMCIQAGKLSVRVAVGSIGSSEEQVFTLGAPLAFVGNSLTLIEATPLRRKEQVLVPADYKLTFKIVPQPVVYVHASEDLITVVRPLPGAVVGRTFQLSGKAKGSWYFEGSFPLVVTDVHGAVLAKGVATAQGDWMTEQLVPFTANIKIPGTYIGPATLLLKKDNPSGLTEQDASAAFPIQISY